MEEADLQILPQGILISSICTAGKNTSTGTEIHENSREKVGDTKGQYYTFMPNVKIDWFHREHISMYSQVSASVLIAGTKELHKIK